MPHSAEPTGLTPTLGAVEARSPAASQTHGSIGVAFALLANFLLTTADASAKLLTARYPVFQVIVMEAAFAFVPLGVMLLREGMWGRPKFNNPRLVIMRGLFAGVGTVSSFYAYSVLPLADVYAIVFCAPILVTLASIPLLGEQVGPYRFAAVAVGFIGILIMVQPGSSQLSLGHLAACGGMVAVATAILIMRQAQRERPTVMVAAVMIGLLAVNLPGCLLFGKVPEWSDVGLAAFAGLIMGSGNFLMLAALRHATAASIAPTQYTMLVWAILYSVLLFNDPIKRNVVAGACLVMGANLYILHRERIRR